MLVQVDRIYRYPVKGLRGEPLDAAALAVAQGLAGDRRFGFARGDAKIDPAAARWLPKQSFVMLMRDEALARLACRVDPDAGTIELRAPDVGPCVTDFTTADGRARIEAYLSDYLGTRPEGPPRWIEARATSFTDVPQNCLSLINLASVRDLETRAGVALDPLRFRGNLYLGGASPWAEFDWVGREVAIGEATVRVAARIPRCAATHVNPTTGARDVNVVKALRTAYGHHDMGVYAEVVRAGRIAVGDVVTPPVAPRTRSRLGHWLRFVAFLARATPIVLRRR